MRLTTREQGIRSLLTGKAGEYAVASKLALAGIAPLFPSVDLGVDLMTPAGCRIQVKSAHLSTVKGLVQGYCFPFPPTLDFVGTCDVVVLWGIEENRFWVVPSLLASKSTGLVLGSPNPNRFVGDIEDMRQMQSLGYSLGDIAKKHGIGKSSAKAFLLSGKSFQEPSITAQVRSHENNWEVITQFEYKMTGESTSLEV